MAKFDLNTAKLLVDFSIQAYEDEENISVDALGFELVTFIENKETDTQLFVAKDLKRIVIAFRGTSSAKDAWTDLQIGKRIFPSLGFLRRLFSLTVFAQSKTHDGFMNAYQSVKKEIFMVINNLMKEKNYERIFLTGHSLGGSLATIAALDIATSHEISITNYTYGAPKVGNKTFVKYYNKNVKDTYRVVNDEDPIPSVPGFTFKHVKNVALIDEGTTIKINPGFLERIEKGFEGVWSTITADALKDHSSLNYKALLNNIEEIK